MAPVPITPRVRACVPQDFAHSLNEFEMGLTIMADTEQGQADVAALVTTLIRKIDDRAGAKAGQRNSALHYVSLAVSSVSLASIIFFGGAMYQKVNQHDADIQLMKHDVAISVQVAAQIADIQGELRYLRQRLDNERKK